MNSCDNDLKPILGKLFDLHVLTLLEKNLAWFLIAGLLENSQVNYRYISKHGSTNPALSFCQLRSWHSIFGDHPQSLNQEQILENISHLLYFEIKNSDWRLEITRVVLANQSALFQFVALVMLRWNCFMTLAPSEDPSYKEMFRIGFCCAHFKHSECLKST